MISWSENLDEKLVKLINETEEKIAGIRKKVQDIALVNQSKVLDAFRKHHLSDAHFANSTGYGYSDPGRDALKPINKIIIF
ncbi:MAG: methionine gamma-lyase family protein [Lactobacillales bacterium]|jgi:cystathionine beta-lyase family protein involved in aluminum resistance|nr:methionine gamma-lyase family protein [Lactobacillales bacterium]